MYRYHFDGYLNGFACGWIIDTEHPSHRVAIGLYSDGSLYRTAYADHFRDDLRVAGIGDGHCAFEIPLANASRLDVELRVLADGTPIVGSRKSISTKDEYVNTLLFSRQFEGFVQFKPGNLVVGEHQSKVKRKSQRLVDAFSRVVGEYEGVAYTGHMQWLCSRQRRGGPSFFNRLRRDAIDDLCWYLFECDEDSKSIANYDYAYIDIPLFNQFKGLEHHTVIFDLWLHRVGRQLKDLRKDGLQARTDFCHALVALKSNVPARAGMERMISFSGGAGISEPSLELPRMTQYLKSKWELGYKSQYQIDDRAGYLAFLFDRCLHAENSKELELYGEEVVNLFSEPVALVDGYSSRFSLICYALYLQTSGLQGSDFKKISHKQVNSWFAETWLGVHPFHAVFQREIRDLNQAGGKEACCFVVAHWKSASGLTQNAHMSVKALTEGGISIVKLLPDGSRYGPIVAGKHSVKSPLKKDMVLLHVNADDAPAALYCASGQVELDSAFVVGFFLWELEVVPDTHRLGVDLVDEIWVPTDFVASAYAAIAPDKVKKMGKAIAVPEVKIANREKFGLQQDHIVFLVSFDFHSSLERKNPLAAVQAFVEAFSDRDDVQLVLKSTAYHAGHWGDPFDQWGQIMDVAFNDDRIKIIDSYLSAEDMFELIACADVIVSPHRSEGFGYLAAYALFYGKKLIVTGYSGTNDYCNASNAYIVKYNLVRVPNGKFLYDVPNAHWADIDIGDLARGMKLAAETRTEKMPTRRSRPSKAGKPANAELFPYSGLTARYVNRLQSVGVIGNQI